ncbi:efflux RND transporter periplasmic adaptor subunit [Paenibacillus sp. 1P07SE]|uniref:efflux RND transporter periplasmic adaptor subunit n=1 Tax=Paenibacillus sp. 1P07SE TaxID=3132209 RepID=UPI0039A48E4D
MSSGCALLPDEELEEELPTITPPQISKKPEYEVTTTTLETTVQGIGKLMSTREERVYFTQDGKRLKELHIKVGDKVAAGQVIGELDVDDMVKDLRKKQLAFRTHEIQMKETLRKRDEMEPVEFEQASIAFEEARQELADLQEEIGKAELTAPLGGTVVSLTAKKGDLVKAYEPICIIADTANLVVTVNLSKTDLPKVAEGMPVTVDINNAGQFSGKIKQLPVATAEEGAGGGGGNPPDGGENKPDVPENYVIIALEGMPADLNRGTPLSARIVTQRKENAVVIPIAALRTLGSRTYVQVVDEQGRREVDVGVGQQTSTQVEILEGLTPGQKVVGR